MFCNLPPKIWRLDISPFKRKVARDLGLSSSVSDTHAFYTDPDSAKNINTDPDSGFSSWKNVKGLFEI